MSQDTNCRSFTIWVVCFHICAVSNFNNLVLVGLLLVYVYVAMMWCISTPCTSNLQERAASLHFDCWGIEMFLLSSGWNLSRLLVERHCVHLIGVQFSRGSQPPNRSYVDKYTFTKQTWFDSALLNGCQADELVLASVLVVHWLFCLQ